MTQYHRPPRDPGEYDETDHYPDAFGDDMRFITRAMARETIADGRDYPREGGPNKVRRKLEFAGVDAVVVIAMDAPVLITAWTEVAHYPRAVASGRWSMDELRRVQAFEDRLHKR